MSRVIATFSRREELERDRYERCDVVEAARPRRAQERLQFRER